MKCQQARDTARELALRRALHAAVLRYRVDVARLPGLRRRTWCSAPALVALFVDGCFWHGCPQHGCRTPHTAFVCPGLEQLFELPAVPGPCRAPCSARPSLPVAWKRCCGVALPGLLIVAACVADA